MTKAMKKEMMKAMKKDYDEGYEGWKIEEEYITK
jgi:hypothetical protein